MIKIKNLKAGINKKIILNNLNLEIDKGELHVIMGRNGTGKSTLANLLTGKEKYFIESGDILYNNKSIVKLLPEERASIGIFMSFQYPVGIPGVNSMHFLRTAVNSIRKSRGEKSYDPASFIKVFKDKLKIVGLDQSFTKRAVNDGFSGGEKKRFEILQMLILEPEFIILDETDSGLDIDALRIVAKGINTFRNSKRSIILITHYQRILDYLEPDKIHILIDGSIAKTGNIDLVNTIGLSSFEIIDNNEQDALLEKLSYIQTIISRSLLAWLSFTILLIIGGFFI